eukprot:1193992-Rhodomonas_salina.1
MVMHQRRLHGTMEQWWGTSGFYCWKDNELEKWEEDYWGAGAVNRLRAVKVVYDAQERFSTSEQSIKPGPSSLLPPVQPESPTSAAIQLPLSVDVIPRADFTTVRGETLLNGEPFTIKGANWFGFETTRNMAFGLDVVAQDAVLSSLVEQGFNSLRLPLAVVSVLNPHQYISPESGVNAQLNPHMPINNYLDAVAAFVERAA